MKPAKKTKARAMDRVPQSREDAVFAVGRIGTLRRLIADRKSEADEAIRVIGEQLEADTAEIATELAEQERGVQTWCEAHRMGLTQEGRVKYHDFGTGRITWRARPPKVGLRGIEAVIEACKKLGLTQFIRAKEEINKEAMLNEPDQARLVAGVTIASEGEDFVIEPAEIDSSLVRG